jgi:hypothetical protein
MVETSVTCFVRENVVIQRSRRPFKKSPPVASLGVAKRLLPAIRGKLEGTLILANYSEIAIVYIIASNVSLVLDLASGNFRANLTALSEGGINCSYTLNPLVLGGKIDARRAKKVDETSFCSERAGFKDCKSFIPGSNPGAASNKLNRMSS